MSLALIAEPREQVVLERRPSFEGSNIGTWIGFKHVMYLVEEGVLQFLRDHGVVPGSLFERYALCLEIVDSDVRLLRALGMDDMVRIEVRSLAAPGDAELRLGVQLFVGRCGEVVKAAGAEVRVVFRRAGAGDARAEPPPHELLPYVCSTVHRGGGNGGRATRPLAGLVPEGANAFVCESAIPYFHCHYTDRIQHSGYVRVLEDVVDRFLADRGISIETLLRRRAWIPVVASARVEVLEDAFMEEKLLTVFTVEEIFKRIRYTARMDCYVRRDGGLVHVATGSIVHGYLQITDRGTGGSLAEFDDTVMAALSGRGGRA